MIAPLLLAAALAPAPARAGTTAAGVVRSKEWVIRRGERREEEFTGDVRYESAGTRLTSDWALFRHAERAWQARGSVVLRRTLADGTVLEARGESARHGELTRRGELLPPPGAKVRFSRLPPDGGEPDRGEGGRVGWDADQTVSILDGAKVWGPRLELSSDRADYGRADGRLTLTGGRPVLRKIEGEWTTALKADRIEATETPRRIQAEGKVTGWLLFRDEAKLKELSK